MWVTLPCGSVESHPVGTLAKEPLEPFAEYQRADRLLTESLDTDGLPGAERVTAYDYDHTQEMRKEVRENGVLQSKAEYGYDRQGRLLTAKITSYTSGTADRVELTTYDYDVSGIRVSALRQVDTNADGVYDSAVKTEFLNDPHNQTAYSQVLVEATIDPATSEVQKRVVYTIGHDRISQTTTSYSGGVPQSTETLGFGQDGHGSTRALFDLSGAIAAVAGTRQIFHYDAYGNALGFDPATAATDFLYSGEQTDSTGLQYLRARYYNPATGRFNRLDPFAGDTQDPQSLHKYLYCHANPVNGVDPSGEMLGMLYGWAVTAGTIATMYPMYATLATLATMISIHHSVSILMTGFDPDTGEEISDTEYALSLSKIACPLLR